MKKGTLALVLGAFAAFSTAPAFALACLDPADPLCVEASEKTIGATTVTWDSSFADVQYDLSNPTMTITVNWRVDSGVATFLDFGPKKMGPDPFKNSFTPRGKDPATGVFNSVTLIDNSGDDNEGSVQAQFQFTGLHRDARRLCEIGNAHLKLYLNIDKDGDGVTESVAGYGVNVHVEDPDLSACLPKVD